MEELFAWHNIWIALGALVAAAALHLNIMRYVKSDATWRRKIIFAGIHLLTTSTTILFALIDNSHPPSPPVAYVNAVAVFVAISGVIATWGLFERARAIH